MLKLNVTTKETDYILDNNFGKVKWIRRTLKSDTGLITFSSLSKQLKKWNRLYYEHYFAD